jgi:exodeoxyribonuclease VII small subunit
MSSNPPAETRSVETLTFEAAMAELQALVRRLEEGKLDLEGAIVAYERGVALRQRSEALLEDARLRIEKLVVDRDGQLHAQPFEKVSGEKISGEKAPGERISGENISG